MSDAIVVENLGKRFRRHRQDQPKTIMEAALRGWRQSATVEEFWALREVSFRVAPGEMLGVIGHNGAGKSTLLQVLSGITRSQTGSVKIQGRIGALLDLGAGFHGDLTGRENVRCAGIVGGLRRHEVEKRLDSIVEFAELAAFIDQPVRTYSTGMAMRLAFAVAIHTDPRVLLVDEFLSVGDVAFQAKCLQRIADLKNQGCAIVLISHSVEQVKKLCDQALWLRQGQVVAYGEPEMVAGQYLTEMHAETQRRTPNRPPKVTRSGLVLAVNENRFGSLEAEILDVRLRPISGVIEPGDSLCIDINYQLSEGLDRPIFSVSISRHDGQVCLDLNTEFTELAWAQPGVFPTLRLQLDRVDLSAGEYFVNVGLYPRDWAYAYDYHWQVYALSIRSSVILTSLLQPPHQWEMID